MDIFQVGECQVSGIIDLTGSSPAAASQLVDRLVQQGLLQRAEGPLNRRIKKLRLTGKGLRLIHQGVASNRFLQDIMASLPEQQREIVNTAFGCLAQASHKLHPSQEQKD